MVNIAIRYVNEKTKSEGVIIAGDKGMMTDIILECHPFRAMDKFPIVFAPTGPGCDSALYSYFGNKIEYFLKEKYEPENFTVSEFTDDFPEFRKMIAETVESYLTKAELKDKKSKAPAFDCILAG